MRKILLYTDTPQVGGAELQMFLLAKFLDRSKYEPILVASNYPKLQKWIGNFESEKIQVHRLNVKHKHDPRHLTQLKKIIKLESPALIHAHIWNPASCRYAYTAAKKTSTPLIITEHDPFRLSPIKQALKKRQLKNTKKIISISKQNEKLLKELYPEHAKKLHTILNGIDTTWWQSQLLGFTERDIKEVKISQFHARKDTLIIISVAALHERKGINYLIEAMPKITSEFPNVKLVIVGEGPERTKLEKLIKKLDQERHIQLLGHINSTAPLMKSANIFCLPSKREAFGLVNLEAMITGLPIVATKVGGIPEIIEDNENGILIEPENSEAIAEALKKLVKSESLREKLGKRGLEIVKSRFSAKKMAEEYGKIYDKII